MEILIEPKEMALSMLKRYGMLGLNFKQTDNTTLDLEFSKLIALESIDIVMHALSHGKLIDSPYTTLEARQYYRKVRDEIKKY